MSVDRLVEKLNAISPDVGAVVVFVGIVRSEGGKLKGLEYETYTKMLEKVVDDLKGEAVRRFPVFGVEIEQKLGTFEPGEVTFVVAVAGRHRQEAFEACRWVVDEFKRRAPVWKKEL